MLIGTANGHILSAGDLSGVYQSKDNGQSWSVIGSAQGLTETQPTCLAVHPIDGNTFYIGSGEGIFKTTDNGNTVYETQVPTAPNSGLGYVETIEIATSNPNIGYASHHEWWDAELTFLKTTDGGDSWTIQNYTGLPATGSMLRMMVHPSDENLVFALLGKGRYNCSDAHLYKSTNGGLAWSRIATDLGEILDFDLLPSDPNAVFATTFLSAGCSAPIWQYVTGDESYRGVHKSIDGGATFSKIGDKTGFLNVGTNPDNITVTHFFAPVIWGNPPVYNPATGTWKTTNGGTTWNQTGSIDNWITGWAQFNYAYTPSYYGMSKTVTKDKFNPGNYYAAYGGFAWITTDGGDIFKNVASKKVGTDNFISTGMDNICGNYIDANDGNSDIIYVGYYDLGCWVSKDNGASWKFSIPDHNVYPDHVWGGGGGSNSNFVVSDPARENVVWASFGAENKYDAASTVFKSTQYGDNWQISTVGLDPLGKVTHGLSIDLGSPVNLRTLYVTQDGDVYKSLDDGASWTMVLPNGGLKFTAVDKFNSSLIYAGGESGLWRSIDGGSTWQESGLPEMRYQQQDQSGTPVIMTKDIIPTSSSDWTNPVLEAWAGVFDIQPDPSNPNTVYVSAHGPGKGVYKSVDAGVTWVKKYTNNFMRGIAIDPNNSDVIYAGSSNAYFSGGYDSGSAGILYSEDAGDTWTVVNDTTGWSFGGRMEIENNPNPKIWAWVPGTGIQYADVPNNGQEVSLSLNVCLEGPKTQGLMMDNILQQRNLLPTGQPYNTAPWNYQGNEGGGWTPSDYPASTVDWVLVSLRETTAPETEVAKVAALLLQDGSITATTNLPSSSLQSSYHIVIEHRNHLPAMTPQPVVITSNSLSYDFSLSNSYTVGAGAGQKQIGTIWCLFSSNADQSNPSGYEITGLDNILWQSSNGLFDIYEAVDFNMDGDVNANDKIQWTINNGIFSAITK